MGSIHRSAVRWYRRKGRHFAWRVNPEPWQVLLASILLKKTPAQRVEPVFVRLLERYPTAAALSEARISSLRRDLRPLGLVSRSSELIALAKEVSTHHGGVVPHTQAALLSLSGVGPYVAAAVRSFAYRQRVLVLDGVTGRVMSRILSGAVDDRGFMGRLSSVSATPSFNYALLDIGALFCKPRNPKCGSCPLASRCVYVRTIRML